MTLTPGTFVLWMITAVAALGAAAPANSNGDGSQAQARYELGQSEAKSGKQAEALAQFIWCFDVGMKGTPYEAVRVSFLLGDWKELAKTYPPAHDALVARRDAAFKKIADDPTDTSDAQDFASLDESLGDGEKTLAYFDKLPIDSPQRDMMGYDVFDLLLEKQRYKDAVRAVPYDQFVQLFTEATKPIAGTPADAEMPMKESETRSAAREIEALAGAGQLKEARELIQVLLKYNSSSEARLVIKDHLGRAGHPDLLDKS